MFRLVLMYDVLKFYSQELENQSLANQWLNTIFATQHGVLLHSMETYDEYLGKWVEV